MNFALIIVKVSPLGLISLLIQLYYKFISFDLITVT